MPHKHLGQKVWEGGGGEGIDEECFRCDGEDDTGDPDVNVPLLGFHNLATWSTVRGVMKAAHV